MQPQTPAGPPPIDRLHRNDPQGSDRRCLIPFDRREGLTIERAAEIAGKSVRTMRLWCEQYQIGRRIGGGPWVVSVVALQMLLDDDAHAPRAYLGGVRADPRVSIYFERAGLSDLARK